MVSNIKKWCVHLLIGPKLTSSGVFSYGNTVEEAHNEAMKVWEKAYHGRTKPVMVRVYLHGEKVHQSVIPGEGIDLKQLSKELGDESN